MTRRRISDDRREERFVEWVRCGATLGEAARAAGIDRHTVWERRRRDPEFNERVLAAEVEADAPVENVVYKAAVAGNVDAALAWLTYRRGGRLGGPIQARYRNGS